MSGAAPSPADPQQPLRFSSADFPSPEAALARFRDLTRDICDVRVYGDVKDFHVASETLHLNGALLVQSRASAVRYDRTPMHVARGIDHFQVVMYLAGGAEFVAEERTHLQRAGDVCLVDMARPSLSRQMQAEDGCAQVVSLFLPRVMLGAAVAAEAGFAVRILPRESAYGRLLADYVLALRRDAVALSHSESQSAVQALALLVAEGVSGRPRGEEAPGGVTQDLLRGRIKLYVENNLAVGSLGIDSLCRAFGLSRAGLYRLLAPHSPMSYIRQRRLHRAFAMLISPAFRTWRIIDIALEFRFSSDATFIRAFRRQFGLSPGEARRLAERPVPGAPPGRRIAELAPDAEASRWIAQLTGSLIPVGTA